MAADTGSSLRSRATISLDQTPLIINEGEEKKVSSDGDNRGEDPALPYGGKVYLARRKKPDSWFVVCLEILSVCLVFCFIYYSYYHFDNMHFHVTHFYAKLGTPHAMHLTGQHYLFGKGVNRDVDNAMQWFKYAADKGHAHSSHNLAVGHLQGYKTAIRDRDEAQELLRYAAEQGVEEAIDALNKMCPSGDC